MKEYNAAGVSFKCAGKICDFIDEGLGLKLGDVVVVEVDKGEDLAKVMVGTRVIQVPDETQLKKVLRIATVEDLEKNKQNELEEPEAFKVCKKFAAEGGLNMKLLSTKYCLDRTKLTFYFTSDGRVDFRQLVRDLARVFRTRIEMRQIGVRDATKMVGGFGLCGKEFCCSCFLRKFDNISIKMAKTQNLILNPSKISGVCGRLMCCLMYEKDQYSCGSDCNSEEVEYIEINDVILEEDKK